MSYCRRRAFWRMHHAGHTVYGPPLCGEHAAVLERITVQAHRIDDERPSIIRALWLLHTHETVKLY